MLCCLSSLHKPGGGERALIRGWGLFKILADGTSAYSKGGDYLRTYSINERLFEDLRYHMSHLLVILGEPLNRLTNAIWGAETNWTANRARFQKGEFSDFSTQTPARIAPLFSPHIQPESMFT